jgi:hypothetical protein
MLAPHNDSLTDCVDELENYIVIDCLLWRGSGTDGLLKARNDAHLVRPWGPGFSLHEDCSQLVDGKPTVAFSNVVVRFLPSGAYPTDCVVEPGSPV